MTRTRFTLDDLGGALSWVSLAHFVANLDDASALKRAQAPDPETRKAIAWRSGEATAAILADLIDVLNAYRYEFASAMTPRNKTRPKKPRPYPRPGAKAETSGEKVIGKDPIPISQFEDWWSNASKQTTE